MEKGFFIVETIMLDLHDLGHPWLDKLFLAINRAGDILIVLPTLAMFIYLWRRSERSTAVFYIASVITFPLSNYVAQ